MVGKKVSRDLHSLKIFPNRSRLFHIVPRRSESINERKGRVASWLIEAYTDNWYWVDSYCWIAFEVACNRRCEILGVATVQMVLKLVYNSDPVSRYDSAYSSSSISIVKIVTLNVHVGTIYCNSDAHTRLAMAVSQLQTENYPYLCL